MPVVSQLNPLPPPPDPAVLLVLLPVTSRETAQHQATTTASLDALQGRLGAAIRVLKIDEASHPAVVRSFQATELPSYVLVRHGVELWRQQGLPEGESTASLLLSKLANKPALAEELPHAS